MTLHDTRGLSNTILLATLELKLYNFIQALERRYSPDQPRVPAGNSDGGQWTSGVARLDSLSRRPANALLVAGSTTNFNYACKALGLDRTKASEILHAIKRIYRIGAAENCTFDTVTGDIMFNGEVVGNLLERP